MPRLREQSQEFAYSKFAYQGYELTGAEPYYSMWNVVTSCYIPHPDLLLFSTALSLSTIEDSNSQDGTDSSRIFKNQDLTPCCSETILSQENSRKTLFKFTFLSP